jgi:CBS domain-containing protein
VLTGSVIRHHEVNLFPAGKKVHPLRLGVPGVTLYGAFGSYGVLKKVARSAPKDYYQTLWSKSSEIPVWIGSCRLADPFEKILEAFSITKFGGARVTRGTEEAIVTLNDAVELIRSGKLSTHMSTYDVSSVPIGIAEDAPIIEAIKKLISRNIRRLFVRRGQGKFISDRSLVDFMFAPGRLEAARDHPEMWLDGRVSDLAARTPGRCQGSDLDAAAREMGPAPDDCLVTDEWRVVSRWDLVVKPWRARKLAVAED